MKNMFWTIGMLILPLLSFSQEKATIKLHDFIIEVNGKAVDVGTDIEETLFLNEEKPILIYRENGFSYGANFTFKKKGNRIKLVRRTWGMKDGGEKKYSKQKKEVQFLKTSNPGALKGKSVENIVLDKTKMESINAIFKFDLKYMGVE
ncbi:MAG: hypothetical protein GXO89_02115 [Chlorobi bacterium]|nr:hypothetical protein [Chlorobiota bacterium]